MAESLKSTKPSLEQFLSAWASEHVCAAAKAANPDFADRRSSEFSFARYQICGLAKALKEAGYAH